MLYASTGGIIRFSTFDIGASRASPKELSESENSGASSSSQMVLVAPELQSMDIASPDKKSDADPESQREQERDSWLRALTFGVVEYTAERKSKIRRPGHRRLVGRPIFNINNIN